MLGTNVLIDYCVGREPYCDDAYRLRVMHEFGDAELWASIQSFADIAYILRGEASNEALQDAFLESLDFLHVCSLNEDDLRAACGKKWADFEDCLIEQCAAKTKATTILSRDGSGFAQSKVPVLTPQAFFEKLAQERNLTYAVI
jgi:hypothetical protein